MLSNVRGRAPSNEAWCATLNNEGMEIRGDYENLIHAEKRRVDTVYRETLLRACAQ